MKFIWDTNYYNKLYTCTTHTHRVIISMSYYWYYGDSIQYHRFFINPLLSPYGIVFGRKIHTLSSHFWQCYYVSLSVDGRLEWIILAVTQERAWSCRERAAAAVNCLPAACCLPSFLLQYSASVRRLAAVPCPGEEFTVRARRRMMRGPCQSLISFCKARWERHVILLESERGGPKESMPINKSNGQPLIYNY